ncbi:hypothetical protein [Persicitalea jodogahamensis]|uniref:Uncharacterized protein n=1 Tax=Persicitalea jodogahamensis TaxID=402147 RepID=A0A8J3D428_9BACT|nr:hypothetical protein [Persicitalea jodogahamensis]GHB71782.1 hypothetical protein GCM10007390_27100 [Persicitalea jodogahamensis]
MENTSTALDLVFILITLVTAGFFCLSKPKPRWIFFAVGTWMLIQMLLGLSGFYQTQTTPPRIMLQALPPVVFIAGLFVTARGRLFVDSFDVAKLTLLHTVRIAVEIVLYFLFLAKAIPEIMTFEGRNLDIVAGITAPVVYYYGFRKTVLPSSSLMLWNLTCLGLLLNIVGLAILSFPTPFQQLAFNQPNLAIMYFPYVWLPSVVVPIVLFSHLVSIRHFYKKTKAHEQQLPPGGHPAI